VMVRMHSECLTGDALGSLLLARLQAKMMKVQVKVVVYLRQEGRGIRLINKLKLLIAGYGTGWWKRMRLGFLLTCATTEWGADANGRTQNPLSTNNPVRLLA